jgi:hypothetical protein
MGVHLPAAGKTRPPSRTASALRWCRELQARARELARQAGFGSQIWKSAPHKSKPAGLQIDAREGPSSHRIRGFPNKLSSPFSKRSGESDDLQSQGRRNDLLTSSVEANKCMAASTRKPRGAGTDSFEHGHTDRLCRLTRLPAPEQEVHLIADVRRMLPGSCGHVPGRKLRKPGGNLIAAARNDGEGSSYPSRSPCAGHP